MIIATTRVQLLNFIMEPSYKKKRDAIYNDIELKSVEPKPTRLDKPYASLGEDRNSENVYQEIQIVNESQPVTPAATKRGKKQAAGYNYLWVIALVAMVASILAIVGVIIVAGVYVSALQENTATLTRQIVELENKFNQTQGSNLDQDISLVNKLQQFETTINRKLNSLQNTTTEQLSNLQSSVDTLNTAKNTAMEQLSSLQSSVNTLNTAKNTAMEQLSSLQSSVNTLNTAKNTAMARLSSLQSSVNTLTTRINSPVNLYQNCIQETTSCTNSASGSTYVKYCVTHSLSINITVSIVHYILYT